MKTLKSPSAPRELGIRASHSSPVIIATDGRGQSDAALAIGRLFADDPDAIRVVTVVKPMPTIPDAPIAVTPDLIAARRAEARREALAQMARVWDGDAGRRGARRRSRHRGGSTRAQPGATMIVCGLGRHRVADRVFGDETALRLIRMADVPVFAVAERLAHAPRRDRRRRAISRRRVCAPRGSRSRSRRPARPFTSCTSCRATARCTNGRTGARRTSRTPAKRCAKRASNLRVPAEDDRAERAAPGRSGDGAARVRHERQRRPHRDGQPRLRLRHADVGRQRDDAHRALLDVQRPDRAARRGNDTRCAPRSSRRRSTTIPSDGVAGAARRVHAAQFGRRGTLEIDDPDIDAQAQVIDYPLLGAAYDPHDECVEIMFGDTEHGRAASHPRHLRRDVDRRCCATRSSETWRFAIAHGVGLTLLTLHLVACTRAMPDVASLLPGLHSDARRSSPRARCSRSRLAAPRADASGWPASS